MKKTTITLMVAFLVTTFFISCGNKTDKKNQETATPADTTKLSVVQPMEKGTKLVCKDLGLDSMDTPHFNIMLSVDGVETKIKTINACAEITKDEYKKMDIPDEAIMARGGWYAGGGEFYYLVMLNGKISVFEGWQEEMQKEKGYHWKEISVK